VDISPNLPRPWRELRPMIAFAFGYARKVALQENKATPWKVPSPLHLKLTRGNCWRGRAWHYRCLVRIGSLNFKPFLSRYPRYRDMPAFWIINWQERLVGLVTHELWHLYRPGHGKPAEHDCEIMEWDSIEAWRKYQCYTFTPPEPPAETADSVVVECRPLPSQVKEAMI
jgi:hypothetical protein